MSGALLLFALAWAALAFALALVATARSAWRVARGRPLQGLAPSLHLVRPIAGLEPRLEENLASLGEGLAPRVTFVAGAPDDVAIGPATRAALRLHAQGIDAVVLVAPPGGPNRKATQLAFADARRSGDAALLWCCDSDVDLTGLDVTRLLAPLQEARVAAAWAQPVERGAGEGAGDASSRALLSASLHAFPLLAGLDPAGLVGKCWVAKRAALQELGGLAAFERVLGEDHALAAGLRARGHRVVPAALVVPSSAAGRTQAAAVARFGRWLQVVRFQRPWLLPSYLLLFLHAGPGVGLALIATLLSPALQPAAVGVAALHLLTRLFVGVAARALAGDAVVFRGRLCWLADVARAEVLLWRALARCVSTSEVQWRGRRYQLARGGVLRERVGDVAAGERREELLGDRREAGAPAAQQGDRRVGDDAAAELTVERVEAVGDGALLSEGERFDVAAGRERLAEADVQDGLLLRAELVADGDGERRDAGGAGDRGGALREAERPRGDRPLAPLRVDPDEAAGAIEQLRGVAQGAGAVGGILQIDAEAAEPREEGQPLEVAGVHEREAVRAELAGEQQRDERIPPAGVVADDDGGHGGEQRAGGLQPLDAELREGALGAGAHVTREPGVERGALLRGDHGALRRPS